MLKASRKPPLPNWQSGKGHCRWCGKPVYRTGTESLNMRALWHSECVTTYKIATRSSFQRRYLYLRDRGICALCGKKHVWADAWEADHRYPLHLVDRSLPYDQIVKYWTIENLQTLCHLCHTIKTAAENRARSKARASLESS